MENINKEIRKVLSGSNEICEIAKAIKLHKCISGGNDEKLEIITPLKDILKNMSDENNETITYILNNIHLAQDCKDNLSSYLNTFFSLEYESSIAMQLHLQLFYLYVDEYFTDGGYLQEIHDLLINVLKLYLTSFKDDVEIKFLLNHQIFPHLLAIDESKVTKELLWNFILRTNDVNALCALHAEFLTHDDDFNIFTTEEFIKIASNALRSPTNRKCGLFILQKTFDIYLQNSSIFTGDCYTQFAKITNVLHLVEISAEKQLHLIKPSLHLFNNLAGLHSSWIFIVYNIFLKHPHDAVVTECLKIIAHETWYLNINDDFVSIVKLVLDAFNSTCNAHTIVALELLLKKMSLSQLEIVLRIKMEFWNTIAFYFFAKMVATSKFLKINEYSVLLNWATHIPDKIVRDATIQLVLREQILQFFKNNDESSQLSLLSVLFNFFKDVSDETKFIEYCKEINLTTAPNYKSCEDRHFRHVMDKIYKNKIENCDYLRTVYDPDIVSLLGMDMLLNLETKDEQFSLVDNINLIKYENIVLERSSSYSLKAKRAALQLYCRFSVKSTNETITNFVNLFLIDQTLFDVQTSRAVLNLFAQNAIVISTDQALDVFEKVLQTHPLEVLSEYFHNLKKHVLIMSSIDKSMVLRRGFSEIIAMKRDKSFKTASSCFIANAFSADVSVENIEDLKIIAEDIIEHDQKFPHFGYAFLKQCSNLLVNEQSEFVEIFVDIIVKLTVCDIMLIKHERMDYEIMLDIIDRDSTKAILSTHFCYQKVCKRVLGMLIVNQLLKNKVDDVLNTIFDHYKKTLKIRYYSNSQIHLEKLRMCQLLIQIIKTTERNDVLQRIRKFVTQNLIEETNQTCVKQLHQISLLLLKDSTTINEVISIISSKSSNPSTVTTFLPILYHLLESESTHANFEQVSQSLLPFTMGANFKIRLYAQYTLCEIYKLALKRQYNEYTQRFKHITPVIEQVLATTEVKDRATLRDFNFISRFNLSQHVTLETIMCDIPKQHAVAKYEWEIVSVVLKSLPVLIESVKMPVFNTNSEFSDTFILPATTDQDAQVKCEVDNIQKKIATDATQNVRSGLRVVASLIDSPANIGGLSRTCNIFGAEKLVVKDRKIAGETEFRNLSMSSECWVDIDEVKLAELGAYLKKAKSDGYRIIGAEQTTESVQLNNYVFREKTILLLGNEKSGIPADLITYLDDCVEIPQMGVVRSLNVHVAGALVIWEYTKQHLYRK